MKGITLAKRMALAALAALAFVGTFALAVVAPLALGGGVA